MPDPQSVARDLLDRMQHAFASKDRVAVAELFDEQLAVFGTVRTVGFVDAEGQPDGAQPAR